MPRKPGGGWNTSEEAAVCERQRPGLQGCGEQAGDGESRLLYPGPYPFCGQSPAAPRGPLPPEDSQAPSPGPSWVSNPSNSSSPSHPSRVMALLDAQAPEPALPLHLRPLPLGPSLPSRLILSIPPSKHPWSPCTQLHPSDHHPESSAALGCWGPLLTGLLATASTTPPTPCSLPILGTIAIVVYFLKSGPLTSYPSLGPHHATFILGFLLL